MNRSIDYRSDYYSLGVTFFHLLTGRLPFEGVDPLELIHAHIATEPPSVTTIKPELPPVLDEIIGKLMSKTAEQRYQSAVGLRADLKRCQEAFAISGTIPTFEMGRRICPGSFKFPKNSTGGRRSSPSCWSRSSG